VFGEFLTQLLEEGKIVFRSARAPLDRPSPRDVETLARAFESHRLAVAGPRIAFDPQVAVAGAEFVRQASFALVNRDDRLPVLKERLNVPGKPATPSHHLSADLTLRYVPQIVRRARGLDSTDPLIELLENVLCSWPLSGILLEGDRPPAIPPDFSGHQGLMLLYAERLMQNDRPAWRPRPPGRAWEYYELVLAENGRAPQAAAPVAASR
jgi:hypothetical protein